MIYFILYKWENPRKKGEHLDNTSSRNCLLRLPTANIHK